MKNSASTKELINESTTSLRMWHILILAIANLNNRHFKNPPIKSGRKSSHPKKSNPFTNKIIFFAMFIAFLIIAPKMYSLNSDYLVSPKPPSVPCIWEICSVDTMKTSRDKARDYLNTPAYDADIKQQLKIIKDTGANYVAIGTPYDPEFLPYLKRWVKYSREAGLKVWFRGNWSNWEGWFDYPKNMTPEDHLKKTEEFIISNPGLFESDDIFDPCPECENAGFWPQNDKNADYRKFVITQQDNTEQASRKIKKWVTVRQSIIGGRAKDVLDSQTFDNLGNIITIDHYVKSPPVMEEFINYFWKNSETKSLISEFGAPIPDMNGSMTEKQQADFVKSILEVLYQKRDHVKGLNYWVLSLGTTSLINDNSTPRAVVDILKQYYIPSLIQGRVINSLGDGVKNITIKTSDGATAVKTDKNGNYTLTIPPRKFTLILDDPDYPTQSINLETAQSKQILTQNFAVEPKNPGIWYRLRLWWKNSFQKE